MKEENDDYIEWFKNAPKETIYVSEESYERIVKELESPSSINENLKKAAERYRKMKENGLNIRKVNKDD